jgi:glucose-6-phosphate 1-dehydrogenase
MSPAQAATQVLVEPATRARTRAAPAIDSCAMVIFGGAGDLAQRKLVPALYNLARDGALPSPFAVVGTGRTPMTDEAFRALHRASTARFSRTPLDEATWTRFAGSLGHVTGDYSDPATFARLRDLARARGPRARDRW